MMKGIAKLFEKKNDENFREVEFFFRKDDVRSFYVDKDYICVFLYSQGDVILQYDRQLVEKLENLFDA